MAVQKKSFSWGKWLFFLCVVGVAVAGWFLYRARSGDQPVVLKTEKVLRGDIVQAVTANGALSPVRNVQVGSQVSGIIKEIFVDFNSHVTNGQIIAKIDPSTYDQNITSAEADLANSQAALEYAALNHKRATELRAAELISTSEFDKTVADLHQAQAVVATRKASLRRNQVDLERTTIFAPIDGVVISRNVDVGQTVAASFSTPTLFQIANDLRKMRIEAMVSETDVGGVEEKQSVTFLVDAFQGRQFRGEVSQVRFAPVTNQNVVSYTCVVDVNNADLKLRPGMTATASIITGEKKDVLRIKNAALRYRPTENLLPKTVKSDTTAATPGTDTKAASVAQAGSSEGSSGGGGERPNREELRKRMESMSPEEREQMRQRFRGGGGGGGGGRRNQEGPVTKTVYVVDVAASKPGKPMLKAVTIKTGIADNSYTEVMEGLSENDEVVTGVVGTATAAASAQAPQGRSPFGGGFGGGGGRGPR